MSRHEHEATTRIATGLVNLMRMVERLRALAAYDLKISETEFRALVRIAESGGITPKELASSLGLSAGTTTAIADGLIDSGYARRRPHPVDGRSVILEPTPAALSVSNDLLQGLTDTLESALDLASYEERRQIGELLEISTRLLAEHGDMPIR